MNLCGWTPTSKVITNPSSQINLQQSKPLPMPISFQPTNNKISVKGSDVNNNNNRVNVYFGPISPGCQNMSRTLPTNSMTMSNWEYPLNGSLCKKQSIIDRVGQNKIRDDFKYNNVRMTPSKQPIIFRSTHQNQRLKSQQPIMKSSFYNYSEPALQKSYAEVLKQNVELKRIINEQYKPLKQMYIRLKQQHQDRQYLVSKLQWKVKELAKEIKGKKF